MLKLNTNKCVETVGQVRVFKIDFNQELQTGEFFLANYTSGIVLKVLQFLSFKKYDLGSYLRE